MTIMRSLLAVALVTTLSACASNPPRLSRSSHEDIPVPKGLSYRSGDSTVIETPTVTASREVYRGRLEMESLAQATRTMLEANGWRHVGTNKTAQHGVNQVYEKQGTALQVLIWEDLVYTYAEYTTARVLQQQPSFR
ncbi:MAG TPA: hypothetical protein VF010_13750 [Methylomirabilota bacterium]|jgi:hypothetical protein|nr:hypothetical protein [Methylomirabilota bacterium]